MWNFYQPVRVVFGEDEVKNLSSHLETLGYKKALLISTPFIVRSGLASELVEQCNGKIAGVFSDIEPNPSLQDVDNAVEAIRAAGADCLVAIGGGSSIDSAKAVSLLMKYPGVKPYEVFYGMGKPPCKGRFCSAQAGNMCG